MNEIKPCPFCGKQVDLSDPDTLYPSSVGWKVDEDGVTTYCNFKEVPEDQWCYTLHCVITSGGCGAEMSGDSKQEAISKWNKRI